MQVKQCTSHSLRIHSTMHFGQKHGQRHGAGKGPRQDEDMFQRLTLTEPSRRTVLTEGNPRNTPTESCESDGTEVEDAKPSTAS